MCFGLKDRIIAVNQCNWQQQMFQFNSNNQLIQNEIKTTFHKTHSEYQFGFTNHTSPATIGVKFSKSRSKPERNHFHLQNRRVSKNSEDTRSLQNKIVKKPVFLPRKWLRSDKGRVPI
jgi:hypothetical protein